MKENRLIHEKSPYLLQHAYNPIEWYPWCYEAFKKAEREDKLIFLSIGYSTCHWCHVMAHEDFEDEEVADTLNKNFISIKVDREERPDLDSIYMNYCYAYTGAGGWPLTIITTPNNQPFFAGTYIPKLSDKHGLGLIDLLNEVHDLWINDRPSLLQNHLTLKSYVNELTTLKQTSPINPNIYKDTLDIFEKIFDPIYGGFSSQQKFPMPCNLNLLMKISETLNDPQPLKMVEVTLENMYRGGIFDHIGGGFSRYSIDKMWLIPHFEKMLYDNVLLAHLYTKAYSMTNKTLYKEVAEKTFSYLLRVLKSKEGGFYCGEDADSDGIEGKFYIFDYNEIFNILSESEGKIFCERYSITKKGNFNGSNILNLINSKLDLDPVTQNLFESITKKVFDYREKRIHPHLDDKILTSWNGLAIAAFAYGGKILENKEYIETARSCSNFIFNKLYRDGKLYRRYRENNVAIDALLEDYSFLVYGLLELYKATLDETYLSKIETLLNEAISLFYDEKDGGFYSSIQNVNSYIWMLKEGYDGALPSGNSVMVNNLINFSSLTSNSAFLTIAKKTLNTFSGEINANPLTHSNFLINDIK